jgi:outer membrane immunogenic protein
MMRKLALILAATVGLIGEAKAADMAVKTPPPPPPVYNWTGCYLGLGGGWGKYSEGTQLVTVRALPGIPANTNFVDGLTQGGSGWLATAQGGCDYQFGGFGGRGLVVGAFVDGDWSDMSGRHTGADVNIGLEYGNEKLRSSWAVGGRAGVLVTPQLLTYFSGGYTEASFETVNYVSALFPSFGTPIGLQLPARTHQGWFIGGGTEYALGWLPGLFWKTEYRWAEYDSRLTTVNCTAATLCGVVGPTAFAERNRPSVQTVRTELVWRFNWGHQVTARY